MSAATLRELYQRIDKLEKKNKQLQDIILKADEEDRYYDDEQLASMFHYANGQCLKNVVRAGRFPAHDLKVGHKWLWKIERIEQFIAEKEKQVSKNFPI